MSAGPVSRGTRVGAAEHYFSAERMPLVDRYVDLLSTAGVERGLIGPREAPRLWDRHVLNCAAAVDHLPFGASVCDVGSGAGLPGLVLALARPDLQVTLLEPLLRRTVFLTEVVDALRLPSVTVVRGRAPEDSPGTFDVVTSRAVAPLERLLSWCLPLVSERGMVLALKGDRARAEVDGVTALLRRRRLQADVLLAGVGVLDDPVSLVRVVRA